MKKGCFQCEPCGGYCDCKCHDREVRADGGLIGNDPDVSTEVRV